MDSSDYVVIATDDIWDALICVSVGGRLRLPDLLTGNGSLSSCRFGDISPRGQDGVCLRYSVAISSSVDDQIKSSWMCFVIRSLWTGSAGTLALWRNKLRVVPSDTCIIATSTHSKTPSRFLPYAYKTHSPIILCDSEQCFIG